MYYPYLRGKQFELILLRENAEFIAENDIHPILEPVKSEFNTLNRTLKTLCENEVNCTIIVNPQVGGNPVKITSILQNLVSECYQYNNILLGYILHAGSKTSDLTAILDKYKTIPFSIIHYGLQMVKKFPKPFNLMTTLKIIFLLMDLQGNCTKNI